MLGRPVILFVDRLVENRLCRVLSSGEVSGGMFSGSAIETTEENQQVMEGDGLKRRRQGSEERTEDQDAGRKAYSKEGFSRYPTSLICYFLTFDRSTPRAQRSIIFDAKCGSKRYTRATFCGCRHGENFSTRRSSPNYSPFFKQAPPLRPAS